MKNGLNAKLAMTMAREIAHEILDLFREVLEHCTLGIWVVAEIWRIAQKSVTTYQ